MQTQHTLTEKKKTSPLLLLALVGLMLSTLFSAYYPSLASAAQQGPTTITATGVLVGPVDDGDEDPTPEFRLTDEESGRTLNLTSGFVNLEDYAGQRVTIEGVRVPGIDPNAYNVTTIVPAEEGEGPTSPGDKATLSFELTVEGEPPANAEFLGFTSIESLLTTPLTDSDGDGTYTGSMTVPATSGGQGGPPEPLSLPVRIVQGPPTGTTANGPEYRVIKDFGQVKIDEDKTFSASVSFEDDGGGQADGIKGTITSISGSTVLVEEDPSAEGSGDKGYFTVTDETEITNQQEQDEQVEAAFEDLEVGQQVEAVYAGPVAQSYPTQGNAQSIAILEELTCRLPEGCDDPGDTDKATLSFELTVEGEPPAEAEFLGLTATESLMTTPLTDPDGDGTYTGSKTISKYAPGGPPEPITISPVQIVQGPPTGYTANGPQYRVIKDFGSVKLDGDKTLSASVSFDEEEPDPEEVSATGELEKLEAEPVVVDGTEICELSTHAITDEATGQYYDLKSDAVDLDAYVGERVTVYGESLASPDIGGAGAERCPDLEVSRIEQAGTPPPEDGGSDNGGSDSGGSVGSGSGSSGGSSGGGVVASGLRNYLPSTGGGMALTLLGAGILMTGGGLLVRRTFR